jgi:starch synthase (maltosyl-transferring)
MWENNLAEVIQGTIPSLPEQVPARVVIENVQPQIDGGRFPIKRTAGEEVIVSADIFADGHESLAALVRYRLTGAADWDETPMKHISNDRWRGEFTVASLWRYEYTVEAWIDRFATWRTELTKKAAVDRNVGSELLEGASLVRAAARRAMGDDAAWLYEQAEAMARECDAAEPIKKALDSALAEVMERYPDRSQAARYEPILSVVVDRERARFGAWYEVFPRSCAIKAGRRGTFQDCAERLDYIAAMGFDIVYLPPIHPIGQSFRKGPNNTLDAGASDPGSPWAIGSSLGGHMAVHPELGTLADFDRLVSAAGERGLEIALDLAFQCSPDHPYAREHADWFYHRPDGTIKYAENPPKKYQDIYPLDFECSDWRHLWQELRNVVLFWIGHGVKIFRVDNPHTKSFRFWEWLINDVQERHPDTIFLSEAFTRPKVMRHLAKCGFSQSYTYFTWRNTKAELIDYFTELTQGQSRDYLRPNLFANTPDILSEYLQFGGRAAFQIRLLLAATLGASYGIFGPSFELCEAHALHGSDDYQDSEKYQIRHWDWERAESLRDFIARINEIRRDNPALRFNERLRFYSVDNDQLLCYSKTAPDLSNVILVVVNLDPHHRQAGTIHLPAAEFGLKQGEIYQVHDLISDVRFLWQGEANYVDLDPGICPAYIFRLRKKIKTERDFDYYF